MKLILKLLPVIVFCSILLIPDCFSQNLLQIHSGKLSVDLKDVNICKWKNGANTCIDFSFDDNLRCHKKISQILDEYSYKATFFVIPTYMYTDSLMKMLSKGHEIGNHTFSHINLTTLDSASIDYQISKGKEMIENKLGIKCVSFAEPNFAKTPLSSRIAFKYELFIRNYSEYADIGAHSVLSYDEKLTLSKMSEAIEKALKSGSILQVAGHGMDGEGYEPVSEIFFRQTLDLVKDYQTKYNIWIVPIREGVLYEDLYHELSLNKELNNDTLLLNFRNFNAEKYKDLDSCMISVEIPNKYSPFMSSLTQSVKKITLNDSYIFTVDLKKSLNLKVKLDSVDIKYNIDSINSVDSPSLSYVQIRPNPIRNVLNITSPYRILKTKIFNSGGVCILTKEINSHTIDLSSYPKGIYLISITVQNTNNQLRTINSKFIKD